MDHQEKNLDVALKELYQLPVPPSFEAKWTGAVRREESIVMNKKSIWKWNGWTKVVLPLAAVLAVVVGAGWAGDLDFSGNQIAATNTKAPSVAFSRSDNDSYENTDILYGTYETNYEEDSYAMADMSMAPAGGAMSKQAVALPQERKLVRTVNLTIRTSNYSQDLAAIQKMVADVEGYEEFHYESGDVQNSRGRYVDMTLRIPADRLDSFLGSVGGVGRVVERSENVEDHTTEYTDNETRLNTMNTKMARLNELLSKAENVDDLLSIENQIADTQYDIDRITGWQLSINRLVDMATVSVTLREDLPTEIAPEMTFGEKLTRAFSASWKGFVEFLRNALVFLIMALPAIAVIAVAVVAILLIRKNRKKKAAAAMENASAEAADAE